MLPSEALGTFFSTACLVSCLTTVIAAYPAEHTANLNSAQHYAETEPFDTPLARFWQRTNDWQDSSTVHDTSLDKRINLPPGRSQFVSWVQNTQGGPRDWIVSLAVVVYTNNPARSDCLALWHALGADIYVAQAVAGNAADVIAGVFPGFAKKLTSETTFFTYNYFGSQVIVAKLYYSDITLNGIRFMAGALSGAWGLGEVISEFEPTNSPRRRTETTGETVSPDQDLPVEGGIVSSAPYTSREMRELHALMSDMEGRSVLHSNGSDDPSGLHRRASSCKNTYLGHCRNWAWSPWNTQWHYSCTLS